MGNNIKSTLNIREELEKDCRERILILDGAHGTFFQALELTAADYGRGLQTFAELHRVTAPRFPQRGNHDMLNITNPDAVIKMHTAYLEAGASIILTNTFNANSVSQNDYQAAELVPMMNREAVANARKALYLWTESNNKNGSSFEQKTVYLAGSLGPTNKTLSLSREVENPASRAISFDELEKAYEEQAYALIDSGVDLILIETVFDSLNARAALVAVEKACEKTGRTFPVMVSGTITDKSGRTLSGQTVEAFAASVQSPLVFSIGLNCSFGAKELLPHIKKLAETQSLYISVHPNAGLPDVFGHYTESPDTTSGLLAELINHRQVNIVGGCCGTTPEHIRAISKLANGKTPRIPKTKEAVMLLAGLEVKEVSKENNFLNVGERNNVAGSIRFARLIREKNYREALSIAREQVENGAQVIDVNVDDGMLDSKHEMVHFLRLLAADPDISKVPVMIDSSDWEVLYAGLKSIQGKNIANSISLKSGEETMIKQATAIRQMGAAVVFMAFDEDGQADTYERKIAICERAYHILVNKAGFAPVDIIFDPNILAIATGMPEHDSYALDYIRACRWIHENLPGAKVSGGVSNLSFSFRGNNRVREAMHSVFLYHAIRAGMDMGIVNPGMLQIYEEVEPVLKELCEDVILNKRPDASERLLSFAIDLAGTPEEKANEGVVPLWRQEPVESRLVHALVKGLDDFVENDVLEALPKQPNALSLIEHVLMTGMKTVGDLFGEGKMFLPQVIRSARVMKKAVNVLLPYIEAENAGETTKAGRIVMATVAGDVHDIGKNIVGVVLGCNNFDIIDLGVMVSKEDIVAKAIEVHADMIGCSGLITPSLEEMRQLAMYMEEKGLQMPLLVGGAATSKAHAALKIAPLYSGGVIHCLDASKSVEVASILCDPFKNTAYKARIAEEYKDLAVRVTQLASETITIEEARKDRIRDGFSAEPIKPNQLGMTTYIDFEIKTLRPFINWDFFLKGWEMQGTVEKLLADPDKGDEVRRLLKDADTLLDEWEENPVIGIRGAFGLFPALSVHEDVLVFDVPKAGIKEKHSGNKPDHQLKRMDSHAKIHFPRQIEKKVYPHTSLADFILPMCAAKPINRIEYLHEYGEAYLKTAHLSGEQTENNVFQPMNGKETIETNTSDNTQIHTPKSANDNPGAETVNKGLTASTDCDTEITAHSMDYIGLFAVTAGLGADPIVDKLKAEGDDYQAIMIRLLCDRLAEAFAEWMHLYVRKDAWGYEPNEALSMRELFQEKYKGIRPAPGYPACPDHALKKQILSLLDPEGSLGMTLTSSNMIVPTASVAGFYFASEKAKYIDARVSI